MRQTHADYVIVGATPLACLLAGLLASAHGKTVLLQGDNPSEPGLSAGLDLSIAAITRPDSWALLAAAVPETTRLVTRIGGRAAIARLDPILFADTAPGKEWLGHIRHMAAAHGLAAERTPAHYLGKARDGVVLRDAVLLRRRVLQPALELWLAQVGVRRVEADTALQVQADGRAQCVLDDEVIEIGQTVLADDSAVRRHVPEFAWPGLLRPQVASIILTQPLPSIASPVMYQLDGGVMLHQQAEGGVLARGPGNLGQLAARLGKLLDRQGAFEQAGQSSAVRLITGDGAPALGRVAGTGPDVLAGLGTVGAFLAPAIARWLCGAGSAVENAWFGARLVDRNPDGGDVAEIGEPG